MKLKDIKFIAHQFSKITDNPKYHFPHKDYQESENYDYISKNMDVFFEDAKKYVNAINSDDYFDVYFALRLSDLESYNIAFKLLEYFDYIIDEEDEKNYTINEEMGLYEFYVVVDGSKVHDFIYGHSYSTLTLYQLSKIVKTPILFKYDNGNGLEFIKPEKEYFIADNGHIKLNGLMEFEEIISLEDLPGFNWQIRYFISLFPTYKDALENSISLKGASSN